MKRRETEAEHDRTQVGSRRVRVGTGGLKWLGRRTYGGVYAVASPALREATESRDGRPYERDDHGTIRKGARPRA